MNGEFFNTYMIAALIALAGWIFLYWRLPDSRKEMLTVSMILGAVGLSIEFLYWAYEWWHPPTFTGTYVGFEDAIYSFSLGGFGAVVYQFVFNKALKAKSVYKKLSISRGFLYLIILPYFIGFLAVYFTDLDVLSTWLIAVIPPILFMLFLRKDLVMHSIYGGLILAVFHYFGFLLLDLIEPGFVNQWYYTENLSGVYLSNMPLDDFIWYFFLGMYLTIVYKFYFGLELVTQKRK